MPAGDTDDGDATRRRWPHAQVTGGAADGWSWKPPHPGVAWCRAWSRRRTGDDARSTSSERRRRGSGMQSHARGLCSGDNSVGHGATPTRRRRAKERGQSHVAVGAQIRLDRRHGDALCSPENLGGARIFRQRRRRAPRGTKLTHAMTGGQAHALDTHASAPRIYWLSHATVTTLGSPATSYAATESYA